MYNKLTILGALDATLRARPHCTLAEAAGAVGVSRRTLQRALGVEGTSFVRFRTAVRRSIALALLTSRPCSMKEVAAALGMPSANAFYHAFRRSKEHDPATAVGAVPSPSSRRAGADLTSPRKNGAQGRP